MRVLVVEDEATDSHILLECLQLLGTGINVERAGTPRQAKALAAAVAPDLIAIDMPRPNGETIDAIRMLRAAVPHVPIVLFSGIDDESMTSEALQAGAQDCLSERQLDPATLKRALRYAIERQQLLDRIARSETRLQEENVILRRLADAAGRVFATFDVRGIVRLLAEEARRLWGGSVVLYEKRASGELVCAESAGERRKPDGFLRDAFESRKPVADAERTRIALPIPGTSGRNEWILDISGAERRFGDNDAFALELLRHYIGIAIQNVALFGELQSQRSSVLRLNQLKDDLIAVLAHDFKGPLTTIIGFAELLEQHTMEGEEADGALRTIRQSAIRLANLANDTLAMSRVEQGELNLAADPVNIAALVGETVDALRGQRTIVIETLADDPVVRGDPARLRQVFENIIGNAMKYSVDGAPVAIKITETPSTVRVNIHDDGIGIPPDELRFLFERFRRASNAKRSKIKGTGLGLYLAKTLVERHGGNVQVQSELNAGSTFTVVLPRIRDGVGGVLRVVVITADEHLGAFILHELRSHGYAARRDKTLTAALERLEVESADVVIVDRTTITADIRTLARRAGAAPSRIALVGVGGDGDDGICAVTLPNPFLTSALQAAMQQVDADRMRANRTA